MYKVFLLFLGIGWCTASCRGAPAPDPRAAAPSPTPGQAMFEATLVQEIRLDTQTGTSYTLDWTRDGEMLAAGSGYEVTVLERDLQVRSILKPEGGALGISWNPEATRLATVNGFQNTTIKIWEWERDSGRLVLIHEIEAGTDQYGVSWSPDGELLAALGEDNHTTIQIWETGTWVQTRAYELAYQHPRRALNWSMDGTMIYEAGESGGQVVIFALNVLDGQVNELAGFPVEEVSALAVSPDAQYFAIADEQGLVRIVEAASGQTITALKTVSQPVDLAWDPKGRTLAVLAYKTSLQLWRIEQ